jgi:CRP/FNR family transcriptional regulator, anaerobic regulatory protein
MNIALSKEQRFICSLCSLSKDCLPGHLHFEQIAELERRIHHIGPLNRGDYLFRTGDPVAGLLIVQTGCLKLYGVDPAGREYIPGFRVAGDAIGLHGFCSGTQEFNAVALSTSVICLIAHKQLKEIMAKIPNLLPSLLQKVGQLLIENIFLAGNFSAEERVSAFLMHFQDKLRDSEDRVQMFLPMSRGNIATYLHLALATVSRILSRLEREGILDSDYHHIRILDRNRLAQLCTNVPYAGKIEHGYIMHQRHTAPTHPQISDSVIQVCPKV